MLDNTNGELDLGNKSRDLLDFKKGNRFFLVSLLFLLTMTLVMGFVKLESTNRMMIIEYSLFIPIIGYFLITKKPIRETLHLNSPGFLNMILIIPLALCLIPAVGFLSALTSLIVKNHLAEALTQFPQMSLFKWILTLAVTPAICEEFVMRGVILGSYKNITIKKAALMNGLMFGILHLNVNQFVYAFVLGVIMAYLVYYTKSIFVTMFLHFCINGTSALGNWALQKYTEILPTDVLADKQDMISMLPQQALIGMTGAVFAWLILLTYKNRNAGNYEETYVGNEDKKFKLFDKYIIISIGIFIGSMIVFGA